MKRYCIGFLFSENGSRVVLIRKNRPAHLVGLLNGIGGKIEDDEVPHDAMVREFEEETGVKIDYWNEAGDFTDKIHNYTINVFHAVATEEILSKIKTQTDEEVIILKTTDIWKDKVNDEFWEMYLMTREDDQCQTCMTN